jgi:hypothetical protein
MIIRLSTTINFDYKGENLWGTVLGYGENNSLRMVTKHGIDIYPVSDMDMKAFYECSAKEFIKRYQYHGDENFKYLYDYYGPYVEPYPWKED